MRRSTVFCLLFVLLSSAGASASTLVERVREHRLSNGMTVLALPRRGAPTVSLQMTFRSGGVDEPSGRTGMAHVLEHMLFKGTRTLGTKSWKDEEPILRQIERVGTALDQERKRRDKADAAKVSALTAELAKLSAEEATWVVKDEIDGLYAANGATGFNAYTTADLTSYVVSLPSNRIELWAAVESERMRDPVLREYYSERDVVIEESRQRYGCDPDGQLHQALLATAFSAHPYRNPVIGWPSDLENLELSDTRAFYRAHYGPSNAVVAAVGDLDPDAFFALVERYFGALPAGGVPTEALTEEPPQVGPRTVEVLFDAEPKMILAYHKPTLPHPDDYVFDVIESVLVDGRSSRLVRELVDRQRLAASITAVNGLGGARYPNLFAIYATPAAGITPERLQGAIEGELERLAKEPPSPKELARVLRRLEADRVQRLTSNAALASQLSYFQTVAGDWRYVEEHPAVLARIRPEEVSRVVGMYLVPSNRTVAILRRPEKKAS